MVKDKKKVNASISKLGGALKEILTIAASHPVTASLAVMTMTVIAKELVTQGRNDPEWRGRFNREMGGLYDGAQKLGFAAAVTPAVVATAPLIGRALTRQKAATE